MIYKINNLAKHLAALIIGVTSFIAMPTANAQSTNPVNNANINSNVNLSSKGNSNAIALKGTLDKAPKNEANRILVVGDSLSAEYGLKRGEGWVSLLEKRLVDKKIPANIQNASISGETTSGGKARIDKLLDTHKPTLVIIELGANDALRGLPLKTMADNLDYMALRSVAKGARVLIVGMQIPPNFGGAYARDFSNTFSKIAKNHNAGLVEFFLKNVADTVDAQGLFQNDRIHPNSKAHPIMMENVYVRLEPMLSRK